MRKASLLAAVLLAAGCSRKPALNYRHCLKLRVNMTREQMVQIMGEPEESFPYIEGKTLPHLKGRTSYEWSTPASMPAPNTVTVDDASGQLTSIRCSDSIVTTAVFVEPPEPAESTPALVPSMSDPLPISTAAPTGRKPPSAPREHSSSTSQSSGRPITP